MKRLLGWLVVVGLLAWVPRAAGQTIGAGAPVTIAPILDSASPAMNFDLADQDPFSEGSWTFQFLAGYFTRSGAGPGQLTINYAPITARFGCILNTPDREDWLRGCCEVIFEANYSPIMGQVSSYFVGPTGIVRYNFVHTESLVIPYVQGGVGVTFTDANKIPDQGLIGQSTEFLLRADVGARFMCTDNLSFDVEAGYQHISNGGLAKHNGGLNNVGATFGFTYFFAKH